MSSREALAAGIGGEVPLVVYHWRGWDGFLIQRIAPNARVLEASPFDSVEDVLGQLPSRPGAFLFQINCSITRKFPFCREELSEALTEGGWILCNQELVNISKRWLQNHFRSRGCNSVAVDREGPGEELVVIKSNYNWGGVKEREFPKDLRERLGIDEIPPEDLDQKSYRATPRAEVSARWWEDPSVAIEKFIGNGEGYYFRVSIAGPRCHLVKLANPASIKKVGKSRVVGTWGADFRSELETDDPHAKRVLAEVRRTSSALGMDFGSMDVVLDDDGVPFVVDVNVTPWFNLQTYFPGLASFLSGGSVAEEPPSKQLPSLRGLLRKLGSRLGSE